MKKLALLLLFSAFCWKTQAQNLDSLPLISDSLPQALLTDMEPTDVHCTCIDMDYSALQIITVPIETEPLKAKRIRIEPFLGVAFVFGVYHFIIRNTSEGLPSL